ncbi:pyridoxal-phosphate dependent enzyme [Chitinasiproducens palmae]|uniref:pyridoxal-phosphate dependent enzyme n=1 Tax=Chitinasiproducens palmae TaxID=1770053 RepID=UPI001F38F0F2|nr:pyridoxal-phosphate dependent enzyme [Chitinasiproducens palmae]
MWPTPLCEVSPGLLVKFECNNPGASHKFRPARHILASALASGSVVPGRTTVIEKTGGNFGLGLACACAAAGVALELVVGLRYSPLKRRALTRSGAILVGDTQLREGASPAEVVAQRLQAAQCEGARDYFWTDQFSNPLNVAAYETSTAPEIATQLASFPGVRRLVLVACAGTGASLAGIVRGLNRHCLMDVILIEPRGCDARGGIFVDHPFEGMSVGVPPPFLDWNGIDRVASVEVDAALAAQRDFVARTGYLVGMTTAACLSVAAPLARQLPADTRALVIAYDHGMWYLESD